MIELIECEDNVVTMENIGNIVRKLRLEKDMSQMDLSTKAGVAPYTTFHIEKGKNSNFATVLFILDALDYELVLRRKL